MEIQVSFSIARTADIGVAVGTTRTALGVA